MTAALATSGLTVQLGRYTALKDVSLAVAPGARHALIGPNGAGKTTLTHALAGSYRPTSGQILLEGRDITRLSQVARVRQGLTRTFQVTELFPGRTVIENVALAIFERERKTSAFWRSAARDRAVQDEARLYLDFIGHPELAPEPVRRLAYGQQRLVEIAVALATRPRILILDEPAAGVPASESAAIFERLDALPRDLTILFVEHDMGLVFRFAERITVLVGGQILTEGTPAEIAADPQVRAVYLGSRGQHAA